MPPVEDRWVALTMRQTHVGGDKLFVDFAGDTVPVIVDRPTGEARRAQIFVAARTRFGLSGYTWNLRLRRRPGESCWSNGYCMARAMHGLAAAQPDLTPTPVDPTPVAKWCASSFNSRRQPLALLANDAATDGQHGRR
jgi:hypothetical protein